MTSANQHDWLSGSYSFHELLRRDLSLSHETLAAELGVPHAANVVSIRHADYGEWPEEDQFAIAFARADYDRGVIELATGRYCHHFVLYRIKRKRPSKPRTYFQEDEQE